MNIAELTLQQLGGSKFVTMTGSYNFVSDSNTLRMSLRKNKSGANMLYITLDTIADTYNMRFFKVTKDRIDKKTLAFIEGERILIDEYNDVYCENLINIFISVTGLLTHL